MFQLGNFIKQFSSQGLLTEELQIDLENQLGGRVQNNDETIYKAFIPIWHKYRDVTNTAFFGPPFVEDH